MQNALAKLGPGGPLLHPSGPWPRPGSGRIVQDAPKTRCRASTRRRPPPLETEGVSEKDDRSIRTMAPAIHGRPSRYSGGGSRETACGAVLERSHGPAEVGAQESQSGHVGAVVFLQRGPGPRRSCRHASSPRATTNTNRVIPRAGRRPGPSHSVSRSHGAPLRARRADKPVPYPSEGRPERAGPPDSPPRGS